MSGLRGSEDLAEFIRCHYKGKVVEVGAGFVTDVATRLRTSDLLDLVATDLEKRDLEGITVQADDIFSPRREIYEGASLLYSLRPPLEVQIAMGDLARQIGADVLVRPLGDEIAELPDFSRRLVNAGEARFYLFHLTPEAGKGSF
jgi:uncharacterized UPF0146 family protein